MLGQMRKRQWLLVAIAVIGSACTGTPEKTYPGPERPLREVAVLQETSDAQVLEIDGGRVSGYSFALLPGTHDLLLRVRIYTQAPNMNWTIWSYCRVRLDAAAGERYQAVVRVQKEVASGLSEKVKMEIGIAGNDDRMRAEAYTCTGKRPSAGK
jgi:hypothetical protein